MAVKLTWSIFQQLYTAVQAHLWELLLSFSYHNHLSQLYYININFWHNALLHCDMYPELESKCNDSVEFFYNQKSFIPNQRLDNIEFFCKVKTVQVAKYGLNTVPVFSQNSSWYWNYTQSSLLSNALYYCSRVVPSALHRIFQEWLLDEAECRVSMLSSPSFAPYYALGCMFHSHTTSCECS